MELPDALYGFGPKFHLRGGFYFARAGAQILIQHDDVSLVVPVNEWVSVVAFTSGREDTGDAWREAVAYLNREPPRGLAG